MCLYQHGIFTVLFANLSVKIMIKTLKKHEEVTPFFIFLQMQCLSGWYLLPKESFCFDSLLDLWEWQYLETYRGPVALILLLCLSAPSVILVRTMYIHTTFYLLYYYWILTNVLPHALLQKEKDNFSVRIYFFVLCCQHHDSYLRKML